MGCDSSIAGEHMFWKTARSDTLAVGSAATGRPCDTALHFKSVTQQLMQQPETLERHTSCMVALETQA